MVATTSLGGTKHAKIGGGWPLGEAIDTLFQTLPGRSGGFRILGGVLAKAAYHLATPHRGSRRVIEYGTPMMIDGPALIIVASGCHGASVRNTPFTHLHGVLADRHGAAHGGHINVRQSIVGTEGIALLVFTGVGFAQIEDRETTFTTFVPVAQELADAA
jgi:hypothetical protein